MNTLPNNSSSSIELDKLLSLYPPLQQANEIIRRSRNGRYLQMADLFAYSWTTPLALDCGLEILVATNLTTGVDAVIEKCATQDELKSLVADLEQLTMLESATAYLSCLPDRVSSSMTLLTATKIHLAFTTVAGYQRAQTYINRTSANQWLKLWQYQVSRHLRQQYEQALIALRVHKYRPWYTQNLAEVVEMYLSRFSGTSGLAMAAAGIIPFSAHTSEILFQAVSDLCIHVEPLFRLVQDVWLDPEEPLNLGIFVLASQFESTLQEAQEMLRTHPTLQAQLKQIETLYFNKVTASTHMMLEKYQDTEIHPPLIRFAEVLFAIAHKLSDACEAMHTPAAV